MEKPKLSYTQIKTFLNCRKAYYWAYVEGLVSKQRSQALQTGDVVHRLLYLFIKRELDPKSIDDIYGFVRDVYPDEDPVRLEVVSEEAARLITAYITKYATDSIEFFAGETLMEADFGDFVLVGRVDAWARFNDAFWRVEHKTTSRMDSAYLNGLRGSLQGAIYDLLTERLLNTTLAGTIYNLLVKTKVPTFHRTFCRRNNKMVELALQTVRGVLNDILRGDFYPSLNCYTYQSNCSYYALCNRDTPETREAFFIKKEVPEWIANVAR